MTDISEAREELRLAREKADREVRLQLESIDQGLEELTGGDLTEESAPDPDRLDSVEAKLDGLEAEFDVRGEVREHVEAAREAVRTSRLERE